MVYDKDIPAEKARQVKQSIIGNKTLKARIDKIYKSVWGRKATMAEYRGLIWGLTKAEKKRAKRRRR